MYYLVLSLLLVFLVPVTLYCLVLATINRSNTPVMITGIADFFGLLLGLSGFLFVVGPQVLNGLFQRLLTSIPADESAKKIDEWVANVSALWMACWIGYYLVILLGIAIAFWKQRSNTAIYNIDLSTFDDVFRRTLERLGVTAQRRGNSIFLSTVDYATPDREPMSVAALPSLRGEATLKFEYFPALSHLTLRWSNATGQLREDVEAELAETLATSHGDTGNPASVWLYGVGGCLMAITFVVGTLVALIWNLTRELW